MKKQDSSSGSRRISRMEKEVRQVVSNWLIRGVDGIEALTTVTRVQMPGDLKSARVYVSWLKSESNRKEIIERLNKKAYEVQSVLARELDVRFTPKVQFFFDDAAEKIMKVESILHELEQQRKKESPEDSTEDDES